MKTLLKGRSLSTLNALRPPGSFYFMVFALALVNLLVLGAHAGLAQPIPGHGDIDPMVEARLGGPVSVQLASGGQALHDVVIASDADSRTVKAADELAQKLSQITGGEFRVTTGDGSSGLAIGTWQDFPQLEFETLFKPDDPTRGDEHLVVSHGSGVYLLGATAHGAYNAVWTFLQDLGYRQYFPTSTWEIVPDKPDLSANIRTLEKPSFYNRNGPRPTAWTDEVVWQEWRERNRFNNSFDISTGHAYGAIIRRNQEEFDKHPEYLSGEKFRVSEPGLVELVVQDAVNQFHRNPSMNSISMDPSDGGGWATDDQEMEFLPHISDRVVYLANKVAEAINDLGYGEKFVGIYAYNQHSDPPTIDVHPNVIVSLATSYSFTAYSIEQLADMWGERGAIVGIRDYYDTFVHNQGLPRGGRGGNVNYHKSKLPEWHEKGVRLVRGNSTDAWVVNGLGYYVASQLQWNVNTDVDLLVEDFLVNSFGDAYEPMKAFYDMVGKGADRPRTDGDLIYHMYKYVNEAYKLTDDPKVIARLNELALYTRYSELWLRFGGQQEAQAAYLHAYRMQSVMMSPVNQLYRHLRRSRVNATVPADIHPGNRYRVGMELEDYEGWWSSKPFTQEEIMGYVRDGIVNNQPDDLDFEVVQFDHENLEPINGRIELQGVSTGTIGRYSSSRGSNRAFTWLEEGQELRLQVRGGTVFGNRGDVLLFLTSPKEATTEDVDFAVVPNDTEWHEVIMTSPYTGLHELSWSDGSDRTHLQWEDGQPMTLHVGLRGAYSFQGRSSMYFYVPKGTNVIGGYMSHQSYGEFRAPDGSIVEDWQSPDANDGYFSIPVGEGQDDGLWRVSNDKGYSLRLMNIPPYLARNERELLLPMDFILSTNSESDETEEEILEDLPESFELQQNFPNPFNPSTSIQYAIPEQMHVRLDIYNILGQRVATLLNEEKPAGRHEVFFDASGMASGIYIYRLQGATFTVVRQMLLVK